MRQLLFLSSALLLLSGCYLFEREKTVEFYGNLQAGAGEDYRIVVQPGEEGSEPAATPEATTPARGSEGALAQGSPTSETPRNDRDGNASSVNRSSERASQPAAPPASRSNDELVSNDRLSDDLWSDDLTEDPGPTERDVATRVVGDFPADTARDTASDRGAGEERVRDGAVSSESVAVETADEEPAELEVVVQEEVAVEQNATREVVAETMPPADEVESPTPVVAVRRSPPPASEPASLASRVDRIHGVLDRLLEAADRSCARWEMALPREASVADMIALAVMARNWSHDSGYQTVVSSGGDTGDLSRLLDEVESDLRRFGRAHYPTVMLQTESVPTQSLEGQDVAERILALWPKLATLHAREISPIAVSSVLGVAIADTKRVLRHHDAAARYRIDAPISTQEANAGSVQRVCGRVLDVLGRRESISTGPAANRPGTTAESLPQLWLECQLLVSDLAELRRQHGLSGPSSSAAETAPRREWQEVQEQADLLLYLIEQLPASPRLN